MFERFDKSGSGHRGKGTESAGIKVRTPAKEGYNQVGSSTSYPGRKTASSGANYGVKPGSLGAGEAKGGGNKMVSVTYPSKGPESFPGTKAPWSMPQVRGSKPTAL